MKNRAIFGEITTAKLDALQKNEDYETCYQLYARSSINLNDQNIRKTKLTLYRILSEYLQYDPITQQPLSHSGPVPDTSIFTSISKNDPQYVAKMSAVLMVLYYCIKNRCYNYVFTDNASHEEISRGERLQDWLETNAASIIAGNEQLKILLSALMVLLYDKVLSATVALFHEGKDVASGITTYHIGDSLSYSEINYSNTSRIQKINALKLICMSDYRDEYIQRRDYWKQYVPNRQFQATKNTFLYGSYSLSEFNAFLAQFDFKLFDISTKYYENYFCHFVNPFSIAISQLSRIIYLLTDEQKKEKELLKKHRDWPFSLLIKSLFKTIILALPIIVISSLLFYPLGEPLSIVLPILAAIIAFLPPFNRMREKKKRISYALLSK